MAAAACDNSALEKIMSWLKIPKYACWLIPANNLSQAGCRYCKSTFNLSNMGKRALDSHMKGKKHGDQEKLYCSENDDIPVPPLITSWIALASNPTSAASSCQQSTAPFSELSTTSGSFAKEWNIKNFINDSGYKELMRATAKFNISIRKERTYRQPYIDGQTGVAQRHCNLFVKENQRMPGISQGQVYTYPARRWKVKNRSYLSSYMQATQLLDEHKDEHTITTVENPAAAIAAKVEENSLDTTAESTWAFYEDNGFEDELSEEQSEENEEDEAYNKNRKRKKGAAGRGTRKKEVAGPGKKGGKKKAPEASPQTGRGKKKNEKSPSKKAKIKKDDSDPEKPFACERRSGRSRGGRDSSVPEPMMSPPSSEETSQEPESPIKHKKKSVNPNPYCDFCLGDSTMNKKSNMPEHLVSCADCGRSGHPTCLQFTDNMMKSVLRYRWQCIECKTCTLCGTSENDDQLLFCDDCDRGYHLYCLNPPLAEPPEGEWSCHLCVQEFH